MVDQELPEQEDFAFHPHVEGAERAPDLSDLDDEVSLVEIMSVLLRQRVIILRTVVLFTGIGLVLALTTSSLYTSSASFLPESSGGAPSGAVALAQQFGFSVGGGGGGERSPQFYADLVTSDEILRQVVTRSFPRTPTEEGSDEVDLFTHYEVVGATEEERIERAIYALSRDLSVTTDRDTGIVRFSITTSDPVLSRGMAALVLELVNDFDLTTRRSQASAERLFSGERLTQLTGELREVEDSLMNFSLENRLFGNSPPLQLEFERLQRAVARREALVTSLAQAHESARIEEVRNTPVITLIESPRVPALRDPRGRVRTVAVGLVTGAIFGVFLAFVRNYREEDRMKEDPQLAGLSALWSEAVNDVTRLFRRSSR